MKWPWNKKEGNPYNVEEMKALGVAMKMAPFFDTVERAAYDWYGTVHWLKVKIPGWKEKPLKDLTEEEVKQLEEDERRRYYEARRKWDSASARLVKKVDRFIDKYGVSPILRVDPEDERLRVTVGYSGEHARGYKTVMVDYLAWWRDLNLPVRGVPIPVIAGVPTPIEYVKVRFLRDVSAIVGADMKTYGPFNAGDVVDLPKVNASVLMKRIPIAVELYTEAPPELEKPPTYITPEAEIPKPPDPEIALRDVKTRFGIPKEARVIIYSDTRRFIEETFKDYVRETKTIPTITRVERIEKPPRPIPIVPKGTTPEQAERLISEWISRVSDARVPETEWTPEIDVVKGLIASAKSFEENQKVVYEYADRFIRAYKPPPPPFKPPIRARVPVVAIEEIPKARLVRKIDWFTGQEYDTYDDEIIDRVMPYIPLPSKFFYSSPETRKKIWNTTIPEALSNLVIEERLSKTKIYELGLPDVWIREIEEHLIRYKKALKEEKRKPPEERERVAYEKDGVKYDELGIPISWERKDASHPK